MRPLDLQRGLRHPLFWPMAVGFGLRVAAALSSTGYFAADDVKYALEPAFRWLDDPSLPYPSEIRSPLFARLLWLCLELGMQLGLDSPLALLRFAYLCLGLYSLAAIPAAFALARRSFDLKTGQLAAWLVAAHALLPRMSTLALIGMAALPLVTLGMATGLRARDRCSVRWGALAGVLLAFGAMLRFQTGLLYLALFVVMIIDAVRDQRWRAPMGLIAGGTLGVLAQGAWDVWTRGEWLGSLRAYVAYNLEHSSIFGEAPWFTYLVLFVLLTLPPLTFWLAVPLWQAMRLAPRLSVPLVVFVAAHSLVPHKEERFMFAVLALFFVLLARALSRVRPAVRRGFWLANLLVLPWVTLADGNRAVAIPLIEAGRSERIRTVVAVGRFYAPPFYLNGRAPVRRVSPEAFFELVSPGSGRIAPGYTRFIFQRTPGPEEHSLLAEAGFHCDAARNYDGDAVDRLLVRLNPAGNKRRRPRTVLDCVR